MVEFLLISLVKLIAGTIIFYIKMGILKMKDEWMNEQGKKKRKKEQAVNLKAISLEFIDLRFSKN